MIGIISTLSFTITLSHNQFTTAHNKSSTEPLYLDCWGLAPFSFSFSVVLLQLFCTPTAPASEFDCLIFLLHEFHRKHFSSVVLECVFIGTLPSNGYPSIVESVTPGTRSPSRRPAMVICVTICFSRLQCLQTFPEKEIIANFYIVAPLNAYCFLINFVVLGIQWFPGIIKIHSVYTEWSCHISKWIRVKLRKVTKCDVGVGKSK
jgi:hypothetical protein